MTGLGACGVCGTPRPANRGDGPWCCSIACYRALHVVDGACDAVAVNCPGCQQPFTPVGRQSCCSDACRMAVHRRGRQAVPAPAVVPTARPRQPVAVYVCDNCGARAVDGRSCGQCLGAMRKVGLGGNCPRCDEPVAVDELLAPEVIA